MVKLLCSYQLSLTGAWIQPRFLQGSHPDTCTDPPSKGSECERRAGHAVMLGVCQCWSRSWSWRLWSPGRVCWTQAGATPELLVFDSEIHSGIFSAQVWRLLVSSGCISAPGGRVCWAGCPPTWMLPPVTPCLEAHAQIRDHWYRRDPQGRNLTLHLGEINRTMGDE